jgi:hypothetical protein
MIPEFSEFTYGYVLIEELSKAYSFKSAPVFPSLREEGTVGGYDSKIDIEGIPFFIQFKRSDFLSNANAKYYPYFSSTYYRFHLHALMYSKQHNLLLNLEKNHRNVFYVAPKFYDNSVLNNLYFNSCIAKKSIWIRPSEIGKLPDNDAHSICFNSDGSLVLFCSEPKRLYIGDYAVFREEITSINTERKEEEARLDIIEKPNESNGENAENGNTWEALFDGMCKIAFELSPSVINEFRQKELNNLNFIQKASKLARFVFGCELLIK